MKYSDLKVWQKSMDLVDELQQEPDRVFASPNGSDREDVERAETSLK
jgi:hypothetical protein